jgi:hypothetical protein
MICQHHRVKTAIALTLAVSAIAAPCASADDAGLAMREATAAAARQHSSPQTSAAPGNGFNYGDAAVGAGITGGIVLLSAASGLSMRRLSQLRHT